MNRTVSQSELKTWMQCQRRHWFTYEKGLRSKRTPTAFLVGTAFHDALSDYYSGVDESGVLAHANTIALEADGMASIDGEWRDAEEWEGAEYQAARVRGMLRAYAQRYPRGEFLDAFALEERFFVPWSFGDEQWTLSGRFDGIAQDDNGEWWLLEHKTAAGNAVELITNLRLDLQVNFYLHMADLLHASGKAPQVAGVLYNVIVKPQIRPVLVYEACWEDVVVIAETKAEAVNAVMQQCSEADRRFIAVDKRRQTPEEYEERIIVHMLADPAGCFVRRYVARSERQRETFAGELASILNAFARSPGYPNFQSCDRCHFRVLCAASPADRPHLQEQFFEIESVQK